ncbi:lytic transglycosylase domain-containing protein [Paenibacillus sp. YYML68]|uniref:lytic transglycosylase domain-containing protein n=1 Tax=Paenibacillus sp. YYML68 TaxID=2909250 RepID=UPI0024902B50|nr:lytic transglycosylase domain-containing protein [Paenibacillus sp. YYML68]
MNANTGSVDTQLTRELLKLQMMNKAAKSTGGANSSEQKQPFADMLDGLMATKAAQQNAVARGGLTSAALLSDSNGLSDASASLLMSMQSPLQKTSKLMQSVLGASASKPTEYEELIQAASRRHGVPSDLIKGVIDAESSFNPNAVSRAGAKGLMQLMDATGAALGVTNPFNPAQNIEGGTKYLSELLMKYNGNESVALAAYNGGPGRMDRLGIRTDEQLRTKLHLLPKETQDYVGKVQRLQRQYQL